MKIVKIGLLQGQDALEFRCNGFCERCRRPSREWAEPDRMGRCIVYRNNTGGFLCPECVVLELRRQLAAFEEAAREAVESSIPYVAMFNAFLISAEAWRKLAVLISPKMAAIDELLRRRAAGEKLTEEEIESVLCF